MTARPRATAAAAGATLLAALVLLPVVRGGGWVLPTVLAVVAVAVGGLAARAARVPLVLHPLIQAAALLVVLTTVFVHDVAVLGFLPGPVAIGDLRTLVHLGLLDAERYAAPVPDIAGGQLLIAGGIGLVALVVDTLAVGLRHPAVAGLPLLAVYAVPAAVLPGGVPWWVFPVAAVGWLVLLAVDEKDQVLGWGRLVANRRAPLRRSAGPQAHATGAASERAHLSALGIAGRRLGALALGAALVVPALIPGLAEPVWGNGEGGGGGGGASADGPVRIDPFVSLRRDLLAANDREIIRYYTDDPDPSYLRLTALEVFDGTTWRDNAVDQTVPLGQALPPPTLTGVADIRESNYNIAIGDLDQGQLPLPFPAMVVSAEGDSAVLTGGDWDWDIETRSARTETGSTRGLRYLVQGYDVRPTEAELRAAPVGFPPELAPLTDLPPDLPGSVARLAREVTAGAPTPYDQAVALQRWFTDAGGFEYSDTVVSGNDGSYLEQFLTERVGYCEQFAASMALMARTLGIPARVSLGFTRGEEQSDGTWSVTVRDAHAWPELWFAGIGWVWFEPTPRSDAGAGLATPPYIGPYAGVPTVDASTAGQVPADPEERRGLQVSDAADLSAFLAESGALQPDEDGWRRVLLAALGGLVLLVAAVPRTLRWARRRSRLRGDDPALLAEGAWADLRDSVRDHGLPWSDADTPRQTAARLAGPARLDNGARLDAAAQQAVQRLARGVEQARYARVAGGLTAQEAATALTTVRRSLREGAAWRTRLRAGLLPASVLERLPWADTPSGAVLG